MIVVGVPLFAVLVGWPTLQLIGRRYHQKKLSDQSLIVDAVWLVFAVVQSIDLAFNGPAWILTGLVAFAGNELVASRGFRLAAGGRDAKVRGRSYCCASSLWANEAKLSSAGYASTGNTLAAL